jgi:carboxymethylenebutenolidase
MAQRLTAADFDPEVLVLFDAYVHGALDRRGFLDKAKKYAVGGMSAAMLLDALSPKFAEAQQVKKDDPRLETSSVEFPSPQGSGTARGYLVRPANSAGKKLPAILVVHENRGLNPHIEDIARRLGLDGYMAFAPDALFPVGGYPGDEDKARTLFATLDQAKTREDFVAAVKRASFGMTPRAATRSASAPPRPFAPTFDSCTMSFCISTMQSAATSGSRTSIASSRTPP